MELLSLEKRELKKDVIPLHSYMGHSGKGEVSAVNRFSLAGMKNALTPEQLRLQQIAW